MYVSLIEAFLNGRLLTISSQRVFHDGAPLRALPNHLRFPGRRRQLWYAAGRAHPRRLGAQHHLLCVPGPIHPTHVAHPPVIVFAVGVYR